MRKIESAAKENKIAREGEEKNEDRCETWKKQKKKIDVKHDENEYVNLGKIKNH